MPEINQTQRRKRAWRANRKDLLMSEAARDLHATGKYTHGDIGELIGRSVKWVGEQMKVGPGEVATLTHRRAQSPAGNPAEDAPQNRPGEGAVG